MKRHLFHLLLVTLILFSAKSYGQTRKQLFENYIDKYSSIAVDEMKKHKIPASITLAQGLLESSAGQSRLAVKGNNHFGIKCSSDWKGPTIKHDDDRRGECFRKYKNAKASYEDHSRFLTTRSRYKALFKLKITDYKGWARGLKDAGYATDKQYPQKLISIIEDYKLYQYDDAKGKGKHKKGKLTVTNYHQRYITNQVPFIVVRDGDTFDLLRAEFKLKKNKIIEYNDLPDNYTLKANDIIYLKKKKSKAAKNTIIHSVSTNESLHDISQKYAIRLDKLIKMNKKRLEEGLKVGDKIRLR